MSESGSEQNKADRKREYNRNAQRVFRQRRKEHLSKLEQSQQDQNTIQDEEIEFLRRENQKLVLENESLRATYDSSWSSPKTNIRPSDLIGSRLVSLPYSSPGVFINAQANSLPSFLRKSDPVSASTLATSVNTESTKLVPANITTIRRTLHVLFHPILEIPIISNPQNHLSTLAILAPTLPPCLRPTGLQLTTPHHAYIDMIPSPSLRDRLIAIGPANSNTFLTEVCTIALEIEDTGQIIIWGEDWLNEFSWEFSSLVLERWGGWLLTHEWSQRANFWRRNRGAPTLIDYTEGGEAECLAEEAKRLAETIGRAIHSPGAPFVTNPMREDASTSPYSRVTAKIQDSGSNPPKTVQTVISVELPDTVRSLPTGERVEGLPEKIWRSSHEHAGEFEIKNAESTLREDQPKNGIQISEEATKRNENQEADSGYGSFKDSGQKTNECTDSEHGICGPIGRLASEKVRATVSANAGTTELCLSKTIVDIDAIQRVVPNEEDIGSQKATVQIPEVITAEKHLEKCLSGNDQVLTVLRHVFGDNNVGNLREDIRELLKYYYLDLKVEARTNLENATANLLRGHWYRERIAARITHKLTGHAEVDLDEKEDEKSKATAKSLYNLDQWLRNNQGFSDPNEGGNLPPEDIVIDSNIPDNDTWESDSEIGQVFKEFDYVHSMEHFIFNGTSFKKLLERIQMQAITPRYYALRRTLMTLPAKDIEFYDNIQQSWFDRLRCGIERRSPVQWDWWPLHQPRTPLEYKHCRISWKCHCGRKHHTDLLKADAEKFKKLIELRCSPFEKDHLCFGRQRERRTWRQFLQPTIPAYLSMGAQYQSPSGQLPPATTSGQTCGGTYSTSSSGTSSQNTSSNSSDCGIPPKSNKGLSIDQQAVHTVHISEEDDLRLVLGVKGKRRCLDVDQVDLSSQTNMNDGELISKIMKAHKFTRGWLRLWFSVYQLRFCTFRKFLKYRRNRISSIESGIPEGNMDYEYKNGSQTPPHERPPISQDEFEDSLYPCAVPCFYWFWPWHDCIGPLVERRLYERVPKKKSLWALESTGESEAWGLESGYKISFVYVIAYHLILLAGTFGFWGWWQTKHSRDMQNAAVPVTVVLALLSVFWTSAGLLRFPEEGISQQPV